MTDSTATTAVATPSTKQTGKTRGAKVNPNSAASRAYAILKSLPADQRVRAKALELFVGPSGLGLVESVASVYFYNSLKRIRAEEASSATV